MIAQTGSDAMPWSAIAMLSPVLILSGVLLAWIGRKGADGRLPRNGWAGIRTPATMASDEAWAAAHRAGGPMMAWAGYLSVVAGGALLVRPSNTGGLLIILGWWVLVMVIVIGSSAKGVRAARAVD